MARRSPTVGEEQLVKNLTTKEVYHYVFPEYEIDVVSAEIYKKEKKLVYYPFDRQSGEPKYENLKKITILGVSSAPRGLLKSWGTGYGFTSILNPLIYRIRQHLPNLREVLMAKGLPTKIIGNALHISLEDFDKAYLQINALVKEQRQNKAALVDAILTRMFPKQGFPTRKTGYVQGALSNFIQELLREKDIRLSRTDIDSIFEMMNGLGLESQLLNTKKVLATKQKIEKVYIERVLMSYEELLKLKGSTKSSRKGLEEKWQRFFKEHSWIFSQLFSAPVLIYKDKAYCGGKDIDNKEGRVTDFLFKNELTDNVTLIEIKTHKTPLLAATPYRGKDVFSASADLSGGIVQVLDQRDSLQKEFHTLQKGASSFEAYNPKCFLVIGSVSELSKHQEKAFDLFRGNSSGVEIITFDEVYHRLKGLQRLVA